MYFNSVLKNKRFYFFKIRWQSTGKSHLNSYYKTKKAATFKKKVAAFFYVYFPYSASKFTTKFSHIKAICFSFTAKVRRSLKASDFADFAFIRNTSSLSL